MLSRANFYTSDEWRGLLDQLKIDRLNEDGQLICPVCGKPIVRKYDCIGHHKIELTDENVNDFTVSLNPENVELIHHACHNRLHGRFEGFVQRVFLVYGSPCAGKTTWVRSVANPDDLIVDMDLLWEAVCLSDRYHKPKRLRANVFGLRDCLIEQIKTRSGRWRNAYLIGGYPLRSDRDRLCELLQAEPVFIEATLDHCISRAPNEEWEGFIREWHGAYVP